MTRPLTLLIKETSELNKVKKFLNSKGGNSQKTKHIYGLALSHFQTYLFSSDYKEYNAESVLVPLIDKKIDVYYILDDFVNYLRERVDTYNGNTKLSGGTIRLYFAGVRSYLEFYGIDTHRVRNRVTLPKKHRRRKQALTAEFIRTILLACNNTRLKVFILVLASSGTRANEALSLRNSDIDFDVSPTKVHIMAENTKTNQERDIYISQEASRELKKFIESKYPQKEYMKYPNHLVFSIKTGSIEPAIIYRTLHNYFTSLLKKVELDKRRRGEGIQRREISFHTFRDYVKTTVAIHTNSDFSEWILGHIGSTYWNADDDATRELYLKCEKYLTFLDYATVETVGKDFESKLQEKSTEIEGLKHTMGNLLDEVENRRKKEEILAKKVKELETWMDEEKIMLTRMGIDFE